jgi:ElaB/YqjD/DUF883 family membrane-anchored ribosome-binding protein
MAQVRLSNRGEIGEAVRHAAAKLGQDLSRTARDAQESASELTSAVRRSAADWADAAGTRMRAAIRSAQEGVRKRPIAWIVAASGIGALIGALLAGRRRVR